MKTSRGVESSAQPTPEGSSGAKTEENSQKLKVNTREKVKKNTSDAKVKQDSVVIKVVSKKSKAADKEGYNKKRELNCDNDKTTDANVGSNSSKLIFTKNLTKPNAKKVILLKGPGNLPKVKMKNADNVVFSDDVEPPSDPELIKFAQAIHGDIGNFLGCHDMCETRQPYVSLSYSPTQLKNDFPQVYEKIVKRISFEQGDIDMLNNYLVKEFSEYLVGTTCIYGLVQRLEDVCDFIMGKYREYSKCSLNSHGQH